MAPLQTRMILHDKPGKFTSWVHCGTPGWCIGPSLDHYRCMQCYISATGIVIITDILKYIPKSFAIPKTTKQYYLQPAIGDIISIMKDPLKTLPFLYYGNATKMLIKHIDHILHISTSQPHLQILLLSPMLPQTQNENPQLLNTPFIPVPSPRVDQFFNLRGCKHFSQHPHHLQD